VLVADWIETGSQAITAMRMAEQAGGRWAGGAVIVDQSAGATRTAVGPLRSIIAASALPTTGVRRHSVDD
jgi:adenine phosphoribosyltransferase